MVIITFCITKATNSFVWFLVLQRPGYGHDCTACLTRLFGPTIKQKNQAHNKQTLKRNFAPSFFISVAKRQENETCTMAVFYSFVYFDQQTTILNYLNNLRSCPAAVKITYLKTSFISTDHKQRPGLWNE